MSNATTAPAKWTFLDIEKQDAARGIYVRNNGTKTPRGTRERIVVIVPKDGMNGADLVSIPDTDIPWDLTAQVSRSSLLRSSDFRRAVQRGFLIPVNPEDAEKILERPSVQKDIADILAMEDVNIMEDLNEAIDGSDTIGQQKAPPQGPNNGLNSNVSSFAPPGVNETVAAIMLSAVNQTEGMTIQSIKAIVDKSVADYEFILKQAKELGFDDLAERVSTKLAKLRENDDV